MGDVREPLRELIECGLPQALEVMGERWSFMILRASFNGLKHFEEFLSELGIATGTAPVQAAGGAYYNATLAAPASEARVVADGVAWACKDVTCVANKTTARPLRVCRGLNRKFGEVAAFTVNGEAMPAEELAKCNG